MIKKTALTPVLITITIAFVTRAAQAQPNPGSGTDSTPAPARSEAVSNPEINAYLAGLKYDPRQILAEQVGDTVFPAEPLPDEVHDDGEAIVIVKQVKHHLSGNLDDVLILNPIHSVVWPGALVKADQDLVRGTPTPIQCRRAPMWLSVDLPGIGGRGLFAVDEPSHGTVQTAIDGALQYWNDHQYKEGYVSESRSRYTSTVVYSAEQLAASLGVQYSSLQTSLSAQFRMATTRKSKVAMALFRQVFYTVSFEPPSHSGAVFHPSVTLDEVRSQVSAEVPPAYVSSVDYGRILMLRLETSADTLNAEIEGAFKRLGGRVKASADYGKTLEKGKVTLITIGGNAEVNARAVDATRLEDLQAAIQGQNALYSKNNPGQPIAYTIRFLKDGRLAKMGYSTDYTELVCERHPHGWIGFRNNGLYNAKFYVSWKEGDQSKYKPTGTLQKGESCRVELKGNAHDIRINGQAHNGLKWSTILQQKLDGPPNKYYVTKGVVYNYSVGTADE